MTPLERAARALCEADIRVKRRWDTEPAELERILPQCIDHIWREYREQAVIVLQAIRDDPSDAMMNSCEIRGIEAAATDEWKARVFWQSMIDAALADK